MEVAVAVEKLKSEVATCWVIAGGVNPEGVDACSVANRSGVEVEAAGLLHPEIKRMRNVVRNFLFMFSQSRWIQGKTLRPILSSRHNSRNLDNESRHLEDDISGSTPCIAPRQV